MGMDMNMTMDHMMMEMPAMFWVQGNTEADGQGAAYVTGGGAVDYYPHPKWASHLLESDPEYNLWEYGMTNMTHRARARARRVQESSPPPPLSAASLTEALALFGSDPVGTPKLLAMGLDVNEDVDVSQPAVYEQFQGWVPGPMLEGAKGLAALRRQVQAATSNADSGLGRDDPATLRVENALLDYCGVCETAGEVAGAGTEVCDVEASCQTLQAHAPPAAQPLFDFDEVRASGCQAVCALGRLSHGRARGVGSWLTQPIPIPPPTPTQPESHYQTNEADRVRPAVAGDRGLPAHDGGGPGPGRAGLPARAAGLPAGQRHHGLPGHRLPRAALPRRLHIFAQ